MSSVIIAGFQLGRKVRCHKPAVKKTSSWVMLQFEPARQDSGARHRDLWSQECEHLSFIESLLFFLCFLRPDTHLVFPGPIPSGEWILAPCGQLTFTLWGLAGLIGIFMLGSDSLSACLFYSRWYWRGS